MTAANAKLMSVAPDLAAEVLASSAALEAKDAEIARLRDALRGIATCRGIGRMNADTLQSWPSPPSTRKEAKNEHD